MTDHKKQSPFHSISRDSCPNVACQKGVSKDFPKFTEKFQPWDPFFLNLEVQILKRVSVTGAFLWILGYYELSQSNYYKDTSRVQNMLL